MTQFVVIGLVLALCALAAVLWPLWRGARGLAVGLGIGMLLAGGLLYRIVGTPAALDPTAMQAPRDIDDAVTQLRAALQRQPDRVEGWLLLGRALSGQQKFAEARDAFAEAVKLQPDQPDVLAAAAQARMLATPDRPADEVARDLLERALQLDPSHQRARWFLGAAQRQAGQAAEAAATWEPLLAAVDDATRSSLRQQIDLARRDAGLPPLPAQADAPAGTAHALQVGVTLGQRLRATLPADTTVFVIARLPDGPPMPVAVEKHTLATLPATVTLDDGDSPMPTQKLSALDEVEVLVRISRSGSPMRQDGDIDSAPERVKLPATAAVTLDVELP